MKKFIVILLSVLTLFTASCGNNNKGDENAPDKTKLAKNDATDYYFYYPEEWILDRNDAMLSIRYNTSPSAAYKTYATISVTSFNLKDSNQVVTDYWKDYKKKIEKTFVDYKFLGSSSDIPKDTSDTSNSSDVSAVSGSETSEVSNIVSDSSDTTSNSNTTLKLNGVPALKVVYQGKLSTSDEMYRFSQVICIRFGTVYILTYTASEKDFESNVPAFDTVIKNFYFE